MSPEFHRIDGIHHITAMCGDPQRNLNFYLNVLGLRLVKLTVNYDDPGTYHIYYGDRSGTPGTILTFFPWPRAAHGSRGAGEVTMTAFAVPEGSLDFWAERLDSHGVAHRRADRFGNPVLSFTDPDDMGVELIATPAADRKRAWQHGGIPTEQAICGFHSATMVEEGYEQTSHLLTDVMGFTLAAQDEQRYRFVIEHADPGQIVDIVCSPDAPAHRFGAGSVHHIAWRTPNDDNQKQWRETLAGESLNVTPVLDRTYFRSIYYREPGGVLFEIATDAPGFTVDEALDALGSSLVLPKWLEPHRGHIEASLPAITIAGRTVGGR